MNIINQAIEVFGRDKFEQMAKQFNAMSPAESDELFRMVKAMPQEQFLQYFKSKGIDIQNVQRDAKPNGRKFNY